MSIRALALLLALPAAAPALAPRPALGDDVEKGAVVPIDLARDRQVVEAPNADAEGGDREAHERGFDL